LNPKHFSIGKGKCEFKTCIEQLPSLYPGGFLRPVAALHLQHNLSDIMLNTAAEKTPPLLPSRLNVNIMSTKPLHKKIPLYCTKYSAQGGSFNNFS